MNDPDVSAILSAQQAVIRADHFVYTSGMHGPSYINKDALYTNPNATARVCRKMAAHFVRDKVEVVIAPAVGAIILAQWVAYHMGMMGSGTKPLAIYADKKGEHDFEIRRGYEKSVPGKRVLVVEDLFTTGTSTKKIVELVRSLGGTVVGVVGLVNRGMVTSADVGDPPKFIALMDVDMVTHKASECPLCKDGVPINTTLGHGKKFLEAQQVL